MPPSRGIHRLAVATAASTFVLLFVGGLVTSTGSALAVPDWPLSFGQVFPPMVGGVLFEHGHRLVATLVGCLTLVLALWIAIAEPRPAVRASGLVALFAVVLQGVLGGVTVLYRLPLAVSVTHACLAQTFFCLTVALAIVTGPGWTSPPTAVRPDERPIALLAGATTAAVFAQLVLGALMRHLGAGLAIPDFPLAFGRVLPPLVTPLVTVHFAHRMGAVIVVLSVATTVARAARSPRAELRRPALVAAALVVVQVALGASIIWTRRAVVPTTSHVALGAALLATCFALTLRAVRLGVRRSAEPVPIGFRREVPA